MTWRSFVDFVTMRELGQEDAVARNYDLTFRPGHTDPSVRYTYVVSACGRFGIRYDKVPLKHLIDTIRTRLRNMGYAPPASDDVLENMVNEWWIWHRIRHGELRTWRYRKHENPLL